MDDQSIVDLYLGRDESAITETDRVYGNFCRTIALNILNHIGDAEECVNDTYHAAWTRIPPEMPQSLRAFLGRITRNLSISRYRKYKAQKRYSGMEVLLSELDECVPSRMSVEQEVEARELSEFISSWLDSLSEEDRALFVRRYWYGEPVNYIALRGGAVPRTVGTRLFRLRKNLKAYLEERGVTV